MDAKRPQCQSVILLKLHSANQQNGKLILGYVEKSARLGTPRRRHIGKIDAVCYNGDSFNGRVFERRPNARVVLRRR